MMYSLEIQKILLSINDNFDDVNFCLRGLKQAISIADKNEDLYWGMELRNDLIHEERATSQCKDSMACFAWILDKCDQFPLEFNQADYLMEYQWMLCSAYSNSNIELTQLYAISEDFIRRLDQTKLSKRGYYFTMADFSHIMGDFDMSKQYIESALKEEFDQENNLTSEYRYLIEHACITENNEQAIVLMEQMKTKNLVSYALPFESYAFVAYTLANINDSRANHYLELAKSSLETIENPNSSMIYGMTRLFYTMHLLEDPLRNAVFEQIVTWSLGAEDDLQFMFARHAAAMFKSMTTDFIAELSHQVPYFCGSGVYSSVELYVFYNQIALDLANRFDRRNGNDFYTNVYNKLKNT